MGPLEHGKIAVSRKQIENELELFRAKVTMQRQFFNCRIQQAVTFRALVSGFLKQQGYASPGGRGEGVLREWMQAHQQAAQAEEEQLRVALKELESQVVIRETLLEQADQKIKVPGRF